MDASSRKNRAGFYTAGILFLIIIFAAHGVIFSHAYFSAKTEENISVSLNVSELFGKLENPVSAAKWGADGNPYLINEERHLKNLYRLQNSKDANAINENTVFQVSDADGKPCYIGGSSAGSPWEIPSIGSEDFPFVSAFRGVTDAGSPCRLPTGEYSDTSAIGNIRVKAYEDQIDIGLFGVVGKAADRVTGSIGSLLLYNISVKSDALGCAKQNHPDHQAAAPHETNHIGILAGHAQNCAVEKISVYYSSTDGREAEVRAFEISEGSGAAKYTSAGGILGFYKDIFVSGEEYSVSSMSNYNADNFGGGNTVGSGTGFMFSGDLWTSLGGDALTGASYNLQENFGSELYAADPAQKRYFTKGVFTFAHSTQTVGKDKIARLWTDGDDSPGFSVADNYKDSTKSWYSFSYEYTKITAVSQITATTTANQYYYMVAAQAFDGKIYTLTRTGSTSIAAREVEFSGNRIIIPGDINNNTMFDNYFGSRNSSSNLIYGSYYLTMSAVSGNWLSFQTSAQTNNTSRIDFSEYGATDTYYVYSNYNNSAQYYKYLNFYETSTGLNGIMSDPLSFDATNNQRTAGAPSSYTQAARPSGIDKLLVYRVTRSSEVTITDRSVYLARPGEGAQSYNMKENVLFYNKQSSASGAGYHYDLISLENLGWTNDRGKTITSADTALFMADSINYSTYYNYGLLTGPVGSVSDQRIPMGSIAFQVQGTGIAGDTADINIIVATNPSQTLAQTFACYDINSLGTAWGSSTTGLYDSFKLPPMPGRTKDETTPVYVSEVTSLDAENKTYRPAYTNLNTVLIAYTIKVACQNDSAYVLGADSGTATFVYFSVDSVAASNTRNPDHENELYFGSLNGIDYVYSVTAGNAAGIATIGSAAYVQSLIMPYFGMTGDGAENPDERTIIAVGCHDLTCSIMRVWNGYYAELYIYASGGTADSANYTESIIRENNNTGIIYADKVYLYINGILFEEL